MTAPYQLSKFRDSFGKFCVRHGWDRERTNAAGETVTLEETGGRWSLTVPVEKEKAPGIRAKLRLTFSA